MDCSCLSYVLLSPMSAVRLGEGPEASDGQISGGFCVLPAGVTLEVKGGSTISGLIDVTFGGDTYAVFRVDLEERGEVRADRL